MEIMQCQHFNLLTDIFSLQRFPFLSKGYRQSTVSVKRNITSN